MANIEEQVVEKLRDDENFQKSLELFREADEKSQKLSSEFADQIVKILDLTNEKLTIEEARFNHLVARMTAAKVLAIMSSFNYDEKEFMEALETARHCVVDELVPMLIDKEPCGQCEQCKNGHPNDCLNPKIRTTHTESRFLPLLSESLIEYDAWSEILYNNIPQNLRDIDVLKDINDDFQNRNRSHKVGRKSKEEE